MNQEWDETNNEKRFLYFSEEKPHYYQFMTGDIKRLVNELNEFGGIVMADNGKVLVNTYTGGGVDCGSYTGLFNDYVKENPLYTTKECHKFVITSLQVLLIDGKVFLSSNEPISLNNVCMAVKKVKIDYLAEMLDEFARDYDLYEYRDAVDDPEAHLNSLKNEIEMGRTEEIIEFLHSVIEECDSDSQEYADRAAELEKKLKDINEPGKSEDVEHIHTGNEEILSYEEMKAIASDSLAVEVDSDKDYLSQNEKLKEESIQMSRFLGEKLMRPHKKGR